MTPYSPRPRSNWQHKAGIATVAILLQVPLFGWFGLSLTESTAKARNERPRRAVMKGRFVRKPPPKEEEELADEVPEDAKVVEVIQPAVKPKPKDTPKKLLADRTTRTDVETRSKKVSRPDKRRKPGKVRPKKASKIQSPDSKSADPTQMNKKQAKQVAMMKRQDKLPLGDKGRTPKKSVLQHGDKSRLFLPSTSAKAERNNLQAASGSMATDDHLKDIKPGQRTALNADKYKFSDFFYRVKDAVRRKWNPNSVYRRRDPTGKLYGVKDRHTVLRVTLDARGQLKKLVTRKHSGLDFMDAEARSAFKRAQPFPNPPEGLLRDGSVRFDFGFYFEISSGRQRFRWRQL